jgi:hypothetical protein
MNESYAEIAERWKKEDEDWLRLDGEGFWRPPSFDEWGPNQALRSLRVTLRVTQRELAARCGMRQAGVSLIESGREISWATLIRIAQGLESDVRLRIRPRRSMDAIIADGVPWYKGKLR